MKRMLITMSLLISSNQLMAEIALPSSVPIEVFKMKENEVSFGYLGFNANVDMDDADEGSNYTGGTKIGTGEFAAHGLIYTTPQSTDTFLGQMFELSYTAGVIKGNLKDNVFTDNSINYNNTFDKNGFYLGVRPAFNNELYSNSWFILRNSTAIHTFLYSLTGDYSVNNGTTSWAYNEDSYGLAMKPTTVIQATAYPTNNLGLTLFGGVTTLITLNYDSYTQINGTDDDSEFKAVTTAIEPIYGYDITYQFGKYKIALSMAVAQQGSETATETMLKTSFFF